MNMKRHRIEMTRKMKNERKLKDIKGCIFLFIYGNEMKDLKSGLDPGPPVVALETPMCHLNVPRNVCHLIVTSYTCFFDLCFW